MLPYGGRRLLSKIAGRRVLALRAVAALVLAVVGLALLGLGVAQAQGATPRPTAELTLVRIPFQGEDELERVVNRYDVWEVNYAEGYALAALLPSKLETLKRAGQPFVIDPADAERHLSDYPTCYAGVEGLYSQMDALART